MTKQISWESESVTMKNKKLLKYFTEQILPILDEIEFNDTEQGSESMWTILVNYNEYAQGVFKSEQYAKAKLVDLVRELEPDEDIPDYDTACEYTDGYYKVLEIKGV